MADEFIPTIAMVGAAAAGKRLRNGTKALQVMENDLGVREDALGMMEVIEDDPVGWNTNWE